ncbi:MAG: 6-phosphofructokinase, partial [Akkermansiaceae bacterium]
MNEKVAILTSGGDAAGMNPAVKSAADYSRQKGMVPYVVEWGLRGLIEGWIKEATHERLDGMLYRGGTALGSSRSKRFYDYEFRKQAFENLQKLGISKLIIIGGDGSFKALNQFYVDFEVPFAGIPATIDNDISGTDYCLGVDTALNMIRSSVDSIRDTA